MNYEEANLNRASVIQDRGNWKSFLIEKCRGCGKTPSVNKNDHLTGNGRYTIRCCNQLIKGTTETEVIVKWNKANSLNTGMDVGSGTGFADIGSGFVEGFGDGIIT